MPVLVKCVWLAEGRDRLVSELTGFEYLGALGVFFWVYRTSICVYYVLSSYCISLKLFMLRSCDAEWAYVCDRTSTCLISYMFRPSKLVM